MSGLSRIKRFLLFVFTAAALLISTQSAWAQAAAYAYDAGQGGLVDQQSGLVWLCGPGLESLTLATYAGAQGGVPENYISSPHNATDPATGLPYADWRPPTIAEFGDAAQKGLYQELVNQYAAQVGDPVLYRDENGEPTYYRPYHNSYWSSDPTFKVRGSTRGHYFSFDPDPAVLSGTADYAGTGSALRVILVRGVAPLSEPPTKGNGRK